MTATGVSRTPPAPMCAGVRMGALLLRILEFWGNARLSWTRMPEHEVYLGES